jgi:hypothetical protein
MQKRAITNLLILVMALLTGMSSQVPVVLCFGEDGHVMIELVEFSHHHNQTHPSPIRHNDLSCDHSGCNDCGDCTDLTIVSQEFITGSRQKTKSMVTPSPSFLHRATETPRSFLAAPERWPNIHHLPPGNPAVNRLLDKMSFII